MIYIIVGIIILTLFLIISSIFRKQVYKQIDSLEARKIQILNKPLKDEISKVKGLEMVGKTEEQFETWRTEWDEIVTIHLPNLEELLFDAEESADRYRFKKAKGILADIQMQLTQIEDRISYVTGEIEELITSEELNRKEIAELKDQYKQVRKYLITHHIDLGDTIAYFDKEMEKISEEFVSFNHATDAGDHLLARQDLLNISQDLQEIRDKVDLVPELIVQIKSDIPNTIKELELGIKEMTKNGYMLDHLGVPGEVVKLKQMYEEARKKMIKEVTINEAKEDIQEIHKKIDQMYDVLEAEVLAKNFIAEQQQAIYQRLIDAMKESELIKEETDIVRLSYQIEQENLDLQKGLEKSLQKLQNRLTIIEHAVNEKSHSFSSIREMLEEIVKQLTELQKTSNSYQEKLQNLRKDELHAIEKIHNFRKSIANVRRIVQKSNLPGLPDNFYNSMTEAERAISMVIIKLDEKPLQMTRVTADLEEAEKVVEDFNKRAEAIIDRAIWAERVIQYGNRYRSRYSSVAIKLAAAEDKFRCYLYEDALELAAEAIEEVNPGILQELEEKFEALEKV
jgi:septation ring formation regulator